MASSLAMASDSITGGVRSLTKLLNLAPGPTAVAGFVADGIFKAIKLGVAIRAQQKAANAALDAKIRAQSVLRTPIVVDLTPLELRTFYMNPVNLIAFPGFREFAAELGEFQETGGNPSVATQRVLLAAKSIVPALQIDPELNDHPDLASLFTLSMNPVKPPAREFVLAYLALFPEDQLPYSAQYDRLSEYWKLQLGISLGAIDQATLNAQADLNTAVKGLVTNAIFDTTAGLLPASLALAKTLKKAAIDDEIAALNTKLAATTDAAAKAAIQASITKLTAWKGQLA